MLCNELRKMLAFVKKLYTDEVALVFSAIDGAMLLNESLTCPSIF